MVLFPTANPITGSGTRLLELIDLYDWDPTGATMPVMNSSAYPIVNLPVDTSRFFDTAGTWYGAGAQKPVITELPSTHFSHTIDSRLPNWLRPQHSHVFYRQVIDYEGTALDMDFIHYEELPSNAKLSMKIGMELNADYGVSPLELTIVQHDYGYDDVYLATLHTLWDNSGGQTFPAAFVQVVCDISGFGYGDLIIDCQRQDSLHGTFKVVIGDVGIILPAETTDASENILTAGHRRRRLERQGSYGLPG